MSDAGVGVLCDEDRMLYPRRSVGCETASGSPSSLRDAGDADASDVYDTDLDCVTGSAPLSPTGRRYTRIKRSGINSGLLRNMWLITSGVNASSRLGGTSLVSRLSACLTEANWWRLIAE